MPSTTDWISKSVNSGKLTLNINKRSSCSSSKRERLSLLIPFNAAYPRSMIDEFDAMTSMIRIRAATRSNSAPYRRRKVSNASHPPVKRNPHGCKWRVLPPLSRQQDSCWHSQQGEPNVASRKTTHRRSRYALRPYRWGRAKLYVFAKHTRNIVPRSRRYLRASQGLRARVDNNCVICEKVFATRGEVAMSINNVLRAKREKKSLQTPRDSKRNSFGKPL